MQEIWWAAVIWVGTHLGISSTPLRKVLVGILGTNGYLLTYSLLAAGSLGWLIWVYTQVPRFDYLWLPNPDLYWVAKITMVLAFILLVGGFMVKNPSNVGMTIEDPDAADELATGVTRITRHPVQWAFLIWALGHMVANGDLVSLIFFGSMAVVSGVGTVLMDFKKAQTLGSGWSTYTSVTSNLPFLAIASGRNRLVWGELLWPAVVGTGIYVLTYIFHEWLSGGAVIV